jgi:hypothetical protein
VSTRTPPPAGIGPAATIVAGGRQELHQPAGGRQEVAERILGVDAALDGPAVALHVGLRQRQLLAGGHADHQLDQVEAGDALGDRVLDLQPRVHLQEVERLVLADDELHRAGALVVHGLGERHGLLAHRLARRRRGTATAPPRSPSGGGAGSSTRAR